MIKPPELQKLKYTDLFSGHYSIRRWLGGPYHGLLVYRISRVTKHAVTLPGAGIILPQSIRSRSRLSRASLSKATVFLSNCICGKAHCVFLLQQQFSCSGRVLIWNWWFILHGLAVEGCCCCRIYARIYWLVNTSFKVGKELTRYGIVVGASTKWSLRFVVWFGIVKVATLLLYVGTKVKIFPGINTLTPLKGSQLLG